MNWYLLGLAMGVSSTAAGFQDLGRTSWVFLTLGGLLVTLCFEPAVQHAIGVCVK